MIPAVILAGGTGERMGLLTKARPAFPGDNNFNLHARAKVMADLCGRPVLWHGISMLNRSGITDIRIQTQHLGTTIEDYFGNGSHIFGQGTSISYSHNTQLNGTGSSLRLAEREKGKILVYYGDLLIGKGFDAGKFVASHEAAGSDVTILAKRAHDARTCGILDLDPKNMKITGLREKPFLNAEQPVPGWINCAVYCLGQKARERAIELLDPAPDPKNEHNDFMRNIFPVLIEEGLSFRAYDLGNEYWLSSDNLRQVFGLQRKMLQGKSDIPVPGKLTKTDGNIWIENGAYVSPFAELNGFVYVSSGASVKANAKVSDCVIGSGWILEGTASGCVFQHVPHTMDFFWGVARSSVLSDSFLLNGGIDRNYSSSVVAWNGNQLVSEAF